MRVVNNNESNTVRELSAIETDQVGGGCINCGDGGPGSCPCLPDVPVPLYFSCTPGEVYGIPRMGGLLCP
jgi:hypothetical protein